MRQGAALRRNLTYRTGVAGYSWWAGDFRFCENLRTPAPPPSRYRIGRPHHRSSLKIDLLPRGKPLVKRAQVEIGYTNGHNL